MIDTLAVLGMHQMAMPLRLSLLLLLLLGPATGLAVRNRETGNNVHDSLSIGATGAAALKFPANGTVITIRSVHETTVGLRHCHNALYVSQWAKPNGNRDDFFWVAESPSLNGSDEHVSIRSLQETTLYIRAWSLSCSR